MQVVSLTWCRWALAAAILPACAAKPCTDERLEAAADAHERLSPADYVERIADACPGLPPILRDSLRGTVGTLPDDQRVSLYVERSRDPRWRELSVQACPPSEGDVPSTNDFAEGQRNRCNFDRFGVLASDDPYISRDFDVFVLLAWLLGIELDEALARRVVIPLLAASASDSELEAICRHGDGGCSTVLARLGLAPLRSTANLRQRGELEVTISPNEIRVGSTSVLPLISRRSRESGPVLEPLRSAIAAGNSEPRGEPVVVSWLVDPQTHYRTFIDAAFTTTKARGYEAELMVLHGGDLRTIPLAWPRRWLPPRDAPREVHTPRLHVSVDSGTVRVLSGVGVEEASVPLPCGPETACSRAVAKWSRQHNAEYPHDPVVYVDAADDAPMQTVVHVLDALRGVGCRLTGFAAGDALPSECVLWVSVRRTAS